MSEAYAYIDEDSLEQTTAPGSSLPSPPSLSPLFTFSNILFPDFENVKTSIPYGSEAALADAPTSAPAPAFIVNDPSKASWAIARILEAEASIAQRSLLAESYKARIDQWLDSTNKQDQDSISYLSFLLEPYVKDEVAKLYKSRTLSLPTGTASLRKLPDRLEITDSTAALAYCEAEHPEAVIVKKELNKIFAWRTLSPRQADGVLRARLHALSGRPQKLEYFLSRYDQKRCLLTAATSHGVLNRIGFAVK